MAILDVLTFPNPRLRKLSLPVESVTPELKKFSEDMLETMRDQRGIGLAAPQVGNLARIIIVDTRPQKEGRYTPDEMTDLEQKLEQPLILFNPVVTDQVGETTYDEGCLSVPGFFETVKRFETIDVEALNAEGEKLSFKVDGLTSICIQHEIDHLDGKLFIDRLSLIRANKLKNQIKKYGYPTKEELHGKDEDEQHEL
jgi:peptide deformylase